jgi:hemoglobin
MNTKTWARSFRVLPVLLVLAAPGCWGNKESDVASSGDPEADQRAEMRVGADEGKGKDGKADKRTLFERLGGTAGITAIVDDMADRAIADPRVNFERKDVRKNFIGVKYKPWDPTPENIARFKSRMVEFLALATGGPAEYTGGEMRTVHKGMKITNSEFDAMVGDVKASMDRLGIATREKRDLLAVIETTRKQIVEK